MDIGAILGGDGLTTQTASSSATGLAEDFSTFLTLLTTQLQNQDPLDPTDTNEFTNQLVAFSQVEQQIRTNDNLENLARISAQNNIASLASLLGSNAQVEHPTGIHEGDGIHWNVQFNNPVADSTYKVRDDLGNVVFEANGSTSRGIDSFQWDGTTSEGEIAPPGTYTLTVNAVNDEGNSVDPIITVEETITSINTSTGDLRIADEDFGQSDLIRLIRGS